MKLNFRLTLRPELRTIHAMKFSHLKTAAKILFVFLVLGLSASPFLTYAFSFWRPVPSSTDSSTISKTKVASVKPIKHEFITSHSILTSYENDEFWPELRRSFHLDHYTYNHQVRSQIAWFQNHPKWLKKTLTNAAPYMYYVYSQVEKRNLPGELVLLPVIESAYDPFAYSDRGAAGLWQLMPGTASGYGIKQDWWYDGRRDIYASTNAALDYLAYLQNFFNGNWLYTLAAYNAGQGTVQNAINYNSERDRSTEFWSLPLPSATISYVPQLLALAAIISDPDQYGINLPDLKNGPYFAEVSVGKQINLTTAARMASISVHELYKLNPGYNRWATDPNGPSLLLLPVNKIDQFKLNLAQLPAQALPTVETWDRYHVRAGDTLNSIATEFGTKIALLEHMNKLNSRLLMPGQILYIPKHSHTSQYYSKLEHSNKKGNAQSQQTIISVSEGDSLWSLAIKYHVQPNQIREWNHLPPNTPLKVGQTLVIKHNHNFEPIEHAKNKVSPKSYHSPVSYKVVSGDTLDRIAHKFGTTTAAIVKLNHLRSHFLRLGQELKIPSMSTHNLSHHSKTIKSHLKTQHAAKSDTVNSEKSSGTSSLIHYTVKSGDTLSSIAHAHHVSIQQVKKWNKKYLEKYLHKGQKLIIYK